MKAKSPSASAAANRAEKSNLTGGRDALARAARITLRHGGRVIEDSQRLRVV
jgi:hypothetical protein